MATAVQINETIRSDSAAQYPTIRSCHCAHYQILPLRPCPALKSRRLCFAPRDSPSARSALEFPSPDFQVTHLVALQCCARAPPCLEAVARCCCEQKRCIWRHYTDPLRVLPGVPCAAPARPLPQWVLEGVRYAGRVRVTLWWPTGRWEWSRRVG